MRGQTWLVLSAFPFFADEVFPTQFEKIYILSVFVLTPDGQKDCASGPHRIEPFMGWVGGNKTTSWALSWRNYSTILSDGWV